MVKQLKMDITPERLRKMMVEADPDILRDRLGRVRLGDRAQIEAGNGGAPQPQQQATFLRFFGNIFFHVRQRCCGPAGAAVKASNRRGRRRPVRREQPTCCCRSCPGWPAFRSNGREFGVGGRRDGGRQFIRPACHRPRRAPTASSATRRATHGCERRASSSPFTSTRRTRATPASLPEDCDTLGEVLPKIQQQMQLDRHAVRSRALPAFRREDHRLQEATDLPPSTPPSSLAVASL